MIYLYKHIQFNFSSRISQAIKFLSKISNAFSLFDIIILYNVLYLYTIHLHTLTSKHTHIFGSLFVLLCTFTQMHTYKHTHTRKIHILLSMLKINNNKSKWKKELRKQSQYWSKININIRNRNVRMWGQNRLHQQHCGMVAAAAIFPSNRLFWCTLFRSTNTLNIKCFEKLRNDFTVDSDHFGSYLTTVELNCSENSVISVTCLDVCVWMSKMHTGDKNQHWIWSVCMENTCSEFNLLKVAIAHASQPYPTNEIKTHSRRKIYSVWIK